MNYRHAFHAGNFADVVKHIAFVAVLLYLKKKDKSFCVIDTHAGRGLYDLGGEQAMRTREAERGVLKLLALDANDFPAPLASYLECVRAEGRGHYPGSPHIAARLLRAQDRLLAIEKQSDEAASLAQSLALFANAKAIHADGYERLLSLVPPHERRGLILIDPPYEAEEEFQRAADVLANAYKRFATGIYLLWFPIKSRAEADAMCGEILSRGIRPALRLDVETAPMRDAERLNAAGILLINPPFGFESEMQAVARMIAPDIGGASGAPAHFAFSRLE